MGGSRRQVLLLGTLLACLAIAVTTSGSEITVLDHRDRWPQFLCEQHAFPLLTERTPHTGATLSKAIREASKRFPNSSLAYGGCLVADNTEFLIRYCPVCRLRHRQWNDTRGCNVVTKLNSAPTEAPTESGSGGR